MQIFCPVLSNVGYALNATCLLVATEVPSLFTPLLAQIILILSRGPVSVSYVLQKAGLILLYPTPKSQFRAIELLEMIGPASAQLRDRFSSLNLHILPTDTTHHTASSHTLLDLMVVGNERSVLTHGKLPIGSSDHDLLYLAFNLYSSRPRPKLITCRNFKDLNLEHFARDAVAADWNSVYSLPDIDSKVLAFNNLVLSLFDKHAPFHTFLAKQRPAPWMTHEIKHILNRRDRASRRFVQTRSSVNHQAFVSLRNRAKQMIRNAKLRCEDQYGLTIYI
ncbi:hypothetical protein M8J76_007088 [Diaphorina citri]|nr:hypothetical protein M8J76_007088 [Diaphorina citri]